MGTVELAKLKSALSEICQKHGVAVCYLFGSSAQGFDDRLSDVDIAVVFFDEPGDDWLERWSRLSEEIEKVIAPKELDLVLLQRSPLLLQWQVISKGEVLYCADELLRITFEERIVGEWLDFSEWLRRFHDEIVEGILGMSGVMLDRNVLLTQLSFVQQAHRRLERLAQLDEEAFLANEDNTDVAQNRLRIAAEAATDMGRHIIARMGWGTPTSYPDVFVRLAIHGVLSSSLARRMEELVRFRDILVHRYPLVTPEELYRRVRRHLTDIGDFIYEGVPPTSQPIVASKESRPIGTCLDLKRDEP